MWCDRDGHLCVWGVWHETFFSCETKCSLTGTCPPKTRCTKELLKHMLPLNPRALNKETKNPKPNKKKQFGVESNHQPLALTTSSQWLFPRREAVPKHQTSALHWATELKDGVRVRMWGWCEEKENNVGHHYQPGSPTSRPQAPSKKSGRKTALEIRDVTRASE